MCWLSFLFSCNQAGDIHIHMMLMMMMMTSIQHSFGDIKLPKHIILQFDVNFGKVVKKSIRA